MIDSTVTLESFNRETAYRLVDSIESQLQLKGPISHWKNAAFAEVLLSAIYKTDNQFTGLIRLAVFQMRNMELADPYRVIDLLDVLVPSQGETHDIEPFTNGQLLRLGQAFFMAIPDDASKRDSLLKFFQTLYSRVMNQSET